MPFSYNFTSLVPNAIVYRIVPRTVKVDVNRDMGIFVQDKWTTGRWTLSGGLRFDSFKNSFPEQSIAGTYFGRTLNIQYDKIDNLSWTDLTPRLGATYDVFGNGRTAFKVTLNKYLEGLGTTGFGAAQTSDAPNPINRLLNQTQRAWADADRDFVPDCDLNNFNVNGECGLLDNAAIFGTVTPGTSYDPDLMEGFGKRAYNWEFTTSVQQEIIPRMSLDVQYARRWYGNIRLMDDLSVGPSDYTSVTLTTPSDSRLPNGGGYTLTGMSLSPTAAAANYFVTRSNNYGGMNEHFDGVNVTLNARLQNGLIMQGGFGTGRQVTSVCDVADELPEMLHTFLRKPDARVLLLGNAQGVLRSEQRLPHLDPGAGGLHDSEGRRADQRDVPICQATSSLPTPTSASFLAWPVRGRSSRSRRSRSSSPVSSTSRLNQLDFRVSKLFRLGGTRTALNFDFYNMMNASEDAAYGAAWRTPTSILLPRLFKVGVQFDF
jgi:hypothetical protein